MEGEFEADPGHRLKQGEDAIPSVLIVDDEADMRFLLRQVIATAGNGLHVVGEAGSGEAAIERWQELRPDIVVLDQRMPGLSGLEVAERILADDPRLPILLFTAFRDGAMDTRLRALGVRACIPKADVARLLAALRGLASDLKQQNPP